MLARHTRFGTPSRSAMTIRPTTISAFVGTYRARMDFPQIALATRGGRSSPRACRIRCLITQKTRKPKMRAAIPHWNASRAFGLLGPNDEMPAAAVPARCSSVGRWSTGLPSTGETVPVRELEMIQAIEAALGDRSGRLVRWTGDDAAVVRARPFAVTSIDAIVDGVHFKRSTHPPAAIGHRALATALSDLAAMGADPGEAYVSLVCPPDFEDALELVEAMERLAEASATTIAGGDVVRGPT